MTPDDAARPLPDGTRVRLVTVVPPASDLLRSFVGRIGTVRESRDRAGRRVHAVAFLSATGDHEVFWLKPQEIEVVG